MQAMDMVGQSGGAVQSERVETVMNKFLMYVKNITFSVHPLHTCKIAKKGKKCT